MSASRPAGEIDSVFVAFGEEHPAAKERRETRSVPARGTRGSRTIEVVHVRSGAPSRNTEHDTPPSGRVRAATWADGFPARSAPPPLSHARELAVAAPLAPTSHVMPPRSPSVPVTEAVPAPSDPEPVLATRRAPGRPRKQAAIPAARRVADPFDAADEGANCLRCGYLVEAARERRGLMTCAACG